MSDWLHSPPHRLSEQGAYMVTCGTYQKAHFLNTDEKLDLFRKLFFECMADSQWEIHAWAVLSNHYHFIASSPSNAGTLRKTLSKLHTLSAKELNLRDCRPGRKVWFQYFDSHITFTNSYLPRLKYVHNNPVHHGIVACAENYPWCSASWFARMAKPAFRATVEGFKTDALSVGDDFEVEAVVRADRGSDLECGGLTPLFPQPGLTGCNTSRQAAPRESGVKPPHSKL